MRGRRSGELALDISLTLILSDRNSLPPRRAITNDTKNDCRNPTQAKSRAIGWPSLSRQAKGLTYSLRRPAPQVPPRVSINLLPPAHSRRIEPVPRPPT